MNNELYDFKKNNNENIIHSLNELVETYPVKKVHSIAMPVIYSLWWLFKEDTIGMKMKALKELHDKGIKFFNYGLSFNKYLKEYKELILNEKVYCYRYKNY